MIFSYRLFPTVPMTAIATPVFKKNFLFELPTDVKQIIKKKEIEVEQENQKIAEKFQELTNADTSDGVDFTYIIDQFKYMSNEEFEDIDYEDELFRMIGRFSIGRRSVVDVQIDFNSNEVDEEYRETAIEEIKKDDARIKKIVDDYGVFKLLKMHQAEFGKIDLDEYDEIELYNRCYYQFLSNGFNSKISYEDIVKMRKFDLPTE